MVCVEGVRGAACANGFEPAKALVRWLPLLEKRRATRAGKKNEWDWVGCGQTRKGARM
jgi:hypothetical protein